MTGKMRVFVKGLIMGICGKPLPLTAQKEPVAYLYNGVRLPKLPEWDREKYPYAVMTVATKNSPGSGVNIGDVALCVCAYPLAFNGSNIVQSGAPERTKYLLYRYSPNNGGAAFALEGEYSGGTTNKVTYPSSEDAFWTNTDVLNENGTIYLAASEPTPVYE